MNDVSHEFAASGPETALNALCVCCFGRGGSSMLWHFLGSSPDVWMMHEEWHQSVFSGLTPVRKLLRKATQNGYFHSLGNGTGPHDRALQAFMRKRVLGSLAQDPHLIHPEAKYVGMKIMDYNIVWHDSVRRGFGGGKTVVLSREPLPQCESLMRSGLTLEEACRKYSEVAEYQAALLARPGVVSVRFRDFLQSPAALMRETFAALELTEPDQYVAKVKPFGENRQEQTDVSERILRAIPSAELRAFVSPDVDEKAVARLRDTDVAEIRDLTRDAERLLGY